MPKLEMSFHNKVSLLKSGFRILAGIFLAFGLFILAGASFVTAEILGIVEEVS